MNDIRVVEAQKPKVILRRAMDVASIRIPHDEMVAARRAARANKCQLADILRTAVHDWIGMNGFAKEA